MRRVSSVLFPVLVAGALACRGEDPMASNQVLSVIILGGSERAVDALGPLQLRALGLDALNREVAEGTFRWHWRTSDPTVATVTDEGLVTVLRNGTVEISASAFQASDTVRLTVQQRATRVTLEQDTVVALTPDAQRVGTLTIPTTEMRVIARVTDANGNPVPSAEPITWTSPTPDHFSFVGNARGDTVRINGTAVGAASSQLGVLRVTFGEFTRDIPVQVASRYAVMRISTTPGGTAVTPSSLTIPVGAAVVFSAVDAASVRGTGWQTGQIPVGGQEAQMFTASGTYQFQVGSAMGTVIAGP